MMTKQEKLQLNDDLVGTAYTVGSNLPDAALTIMVKQLSKYTYLQVKAALNRCALEVTNRLPLAEIISRIDDGRPDVEKAWSQVSHYDADDTYSEVITEEQSYARGACWSLLIANDNIAARMAFKEEYVKLCAENRAKGLPVKYVTHFGTNKESRLDVVKQALLEGKITQEAAIKKLPERKQEILSLPALPDASEAISGLISGLSAKVKEA